VAVAAEREGDGGGVAARGAELEREARGRGPPDAVRREAHVEEADLEAAAGVRLRRRRRRRVVHPRRAARWRGEALGLRGHGREMEGDLDIWRRWSRVEEAIAKKLVD
jgi:hypothetical protein